MVRIIWSPVAASDLEEISDYIAKDSEYYARVFAQGVINGCLFFLNLAGLCRNTIKKTFAR